MQMRIHVSDCTVYKSFYMKLILRMDHIIFAHADSSHLSSCSMYSHSARSYSSVRVLPLGGRVLFEALPFERRSNVRGVIPNANAAAHTLEHSSWRNAFKALMIFSSCSQYISDIMMVVGCALDMVGKMSRNRSLRCMGLRGVWDWEAARPPGPRDGYSYSSWFAAWEGEFFSFIKKKFFLIRGKKKPHESDRPMLKDAG